MTPPLSSPFYTFLRLCTNIRSSSAGCDPLFCCLFILENQGRAERLKDQHEPSPIATEGETDGPLVAKPGLGLKPAKPRKPAVDEGSQQSSAPDWVVLAKAKQRSVCKLLKTEFGLGNGSGVEGTTFQIFCAQMASTEVFALPLPLVNARCHM